MKKRKMTAKLLLALFAATLSVTLFSCYPYGSTNPADYDVVVTLHDPLSNFTGQYKKYAMRDSVAHISDGQSSGTITRQYDALIRSQVVNNLAAYGYTRVTDTATADVIITLAVTKSTTLYVNNYWPDDYWYWGYGYYYPWSYAYSVTTGSVVTTMIDKKKVQTGTNKIQPVWMGIINGALDGSGNASTRISTGIDKCFLQSAYLKASN